ncbi:MAG: RNA-binding S4 domain-containing protein [Mycoplasmatales bacterium]
MEKIIINTEYIQLVQLLKMLNYISSGGECKYFMNENKILINNEIPFEKRKKIYDNFEVIINDKEYLIKSEIKKD